MDTKDSKAGAQATAEIIQFQKKEEAKFICSACGADRGCNCNAPAIEKLAHKQEQDRQRAKTYRERKAEGNQAPRHVTETGSSGFNAACAWAKRLGHEVEELASGGFRLRSSPNAAPVCCPSLKKLNEALAEIERDRAECIALFKKAEAAEHELAQHLEKVSADKAIVAAQPVPVEPSTTLTVEQLALAMKKLGAKAVNAAIDLVPEIKAANTEHVLAQHKRPYINKNMTNALRAGLGTNKPAANQAAITKIVMELNRLNLDRNDVSIVIRKPSDAVQEHEAEPELHNGQGASRLIPAGNGAADDEARA